MLDGIACLEEVLVRRLSRYIVGVSVSRSGDGEGAEDGGTVGEIRRNTVTEEWNGEDRHVV